MEENLLLFLLLLWNTTVVCGGINDRGRQQNYHNQDPYSNRNYMSGGGGGRKSSGFNATTSFISRGPDSLEAESKRRKFSNVELLRLFRSAGCNDDEIELVCENNVNDTIVIENASFFAVQKGSLNCSRGPLGPLSGRAYGTAREDSLKDTFFPKLMGLPRASRDLRQALNRRCSGLGNGQPCSFNLGLDHPESQNWGPGLVDIYFRCAPQSRTHKFCEEQVRVARDVSGESEFLMSPVYPKYYHGGRTCTWSLRAEPGQRIQLRFLDISLRERVSSTDPECTDSVSVWERSRTLMRMCGESSEDIMLLSESHTLEVRLDTRTKTVFPRRGILAEFWPIGCPNQPQPTDGYLQARNDTHAVYACSLGHVFLPDLSRTKSVECRERQWLQTVGNCFSYQFLRKYGNSTVVKALDARLGPASTPATTFVEAGIVSPDKKTVTWFSDVVFPVIVVGVVVILSLFALIVLLLLRRHLTFEMGGMEVGRTGSGSIDEDRSALTPASIRRTSPVLQPLEQGAQYLQENNVNNLLQLHHHHHHVQHHHQQQQQQQQLQPQNRTSEELFLC